MENGQVTITWQGWPGRTYEIQLRDSLTQDDWIPQPPPLEVGPTQRVMQWTDPNAPPGTGRYYRIFMPFKE